MGEGGVEVGLVTKFSQPLPPSRPKKPYEEGGRARSLEFSFFRERGKCGVGEGKDGIHSTKRERKTKLGFTHASHSRLKIGKLCLRLLLRVFVFPNSFILYFFGVLLLNCSANSSFSRRGGSKPTPPLFNFAESIFVVCEKA